MLRSLFRLFFKNKNEEIEIPNKLYGFDLDKWNYLGTGECSYVNQGQTEPWAVAYIFQFEHKVTKKRDYHITSPCSWADWKGHPFVAKGLATWKTGEKDWYTYINDEPSEYSKNIMLKSNVVWNPQTKWWDSNDNVKYDKALKEASEKKDPKVISTQNNVVSVDFSKKD